ncbi:minor capsid protein [Hathewaya histolytica]|uniref:NAD:arginine ADP-ribosyltransferase ART n=1 Tax=Hathewaya histolytica TaxID=1498 RepID=A0A4U9R6V2_HATHI|nr:minor capsid protein [Hathewaya histolytica]VTQ86949.1 NAD:arginine ADP-ribosyltransferase ART [Hathewaya histolytica]
MTREEEFMLSLYENEIEEVYKEQKKNRDELLQDIALIMLTYTILDNVMNMTSKERNKEYAKLSTIIINMTRGQAKTQNKVIKDILDNTVKKTCDFYNYNAKQKDVKKVIDKSFKGKHFSKRVWENEQEVAKKLHKEIDRFLNGKINVNKIKKEIEKTFNTNVYSAKRLVETEVNRCSNEAFTRFCEETGVKKLRYNATLDNRTCDDCSKYDGNVYDFGKEIELPRHPLCRCFYTIEE